MGKEIAIVMMPIADIIPYENNPRKNDNAVDKVAASIKKFGFKVPMILDKNGVIVAGHTRLKAALKLGLKEVPVILADDLTDEQIKAFRLADNKTAELADWDFEALKRELAEIQDIDMAEFGFLLQEIEKTNKAAGGSSEHATKEAEEILCPRCGTLVEVIA